ncbi:MAG TPA: hypothetical protein VNZ64_11815 [Candidatus Acidoferrum sp.]|jgi:hypothetical protein|nr:hypothetical protein [Candidatus Acidoferrum sp.]
MPLPNPNEAFLVSSGIPPRTLRLNDTQTKACDLADLFHAFPPP